MKMIFLEKKNLKKIGIDYSNDPKYFVKSFVWEKKAVILNLPKK